MADKICTYNDIREYIDARSITGDVTWNRCVTPTALQSAVAEDYEYTINGSYASDRLVPKNKIEFSSRSSRVRLQIECISAPAITSTISLVANGEGYGETYTPSNYSNKIRTALFDLSEWNGSASITLSQGTRYNGGRYRLRFLGEDGYDIFDTTCQDITISEVAENTYNAFVDWGDLGLDNSTGSLQFTLCQDTSAVGTFYFQKTIDGFIHQFGVSFKTI